MGDRPTWDESIKRLGGLSPLAGGPFVPLSEREIEVVESHIGAKLPDDYHSFLTTHGASTFNSLASIRSAGPLPDSLSDDGLLPFGSFYGINREENAFPDLRFCAEQFKPEIPDSLLPIADAGNDDQICLGLTGGLRGKVFYWDSQGLNDDSEEPSDQVDNEESLTQRNIYLIAESFTDLMNRIEPFAG
jgi:hypothetical protein